MFAKVARCDPGRFRMSAGTLAERGADREPQTRREQPGDQLPDLFGLLHQHRAHLHRAWLHLFLDRFRILGQCDRIFQRIGDVHCADPDEYRI